MDPQSKEHQDAKRSSFLSLVGVAVILVLLYVLGVGPMNRLALTGTIPPRWVFPIYAPLERLCVQTGTSSELYLWYAHLWGLHAFQWNGQIVHAFYRDGVGAVPP